MRTCNPPNRLKNLLHDNFPFPPPPRALPNMFPQLRTCPSVICTLRNASNASPRYVAMSYNKYSLIIGKGEYLAFMFNVRLKIGSTRVHVAWENVHGGKRGGSSSANKSSHTPRKASVPHRSKKVCPVNSPGKRLTLISP